MKLHVTTNSMHADADVPAGTFHALPPLSWGTHYVQLSPTHLKCLRSLGKRTHVQSQPQQSRVRRLPGDTHTCTHRGTGRRLLSCGARGCVSWAAVPHQPVGSYPSRGSRGKTQVVKKSNIHSSPLWIVLSVLNLQTHDHTRRHAGFLLWDLLEVL